MIRQIPKVRIFLHDNQYYALCAVLMRDDEAVYLNYRLSNGFSIFNHTNSIAYLVDTCDLECPVIFLKLAVFHCNVSLSHTPSLFYRFTDWCDYGSASSGIRIPQHCYQGITIEFISRLFVA
jgi:hypothetical protein